VALPLCIINQELLRNLRQKDVSETRGSRVFQHFHIH